MSVLDPVEVSLHLRLSKEGRIQEREYVGRWALTDVHHCILKHHIRQGSATDYVRRDHEDRMTDGWEFRSVNPNCYLDKIRGFLTKEWDQWKAEVISSNLDNITVCISELWAVIGSGLGYTFYLRCLRQFGGGYVEFKAPDGVKVDQTGSLAVELPWKRSEPMFFKVGDRPWPWPLFNSAKPSLRSLTQILTPGDTQFLTMLMRSVQPYIGIGKRLAVDLQEVYLQTLTEEDGAPLRICRSQEGLREVLEQALGDENAS